MADIARKYKVHANVAYKWKRQLLDNLTVVFETESGDGSDASEREAELLRKIGGLTVEVFVERLWRSLKYEDVFLRSYDSLPEARAGIGRYMTFFNDERPHAALGYQTPTSFYDGEKRKVA